MVSDPDSGCSAPTTEFLNPTGLGNIIFKMPVGLFVIAVGSFLVVLPHLNSIRTGAATTALPPVSVPPPTTDPVPTSTSPESGVKITSPQQGASVRGSQGIVIVGTVTGLGADTLWVFDHDLGNNRYYRATDAPLEVRDGRWSFLDRPIGSGPDDVGTTFPLVVVRADPECTRTLRAAKPDADGDIVFASLPSGCVEAASVQVVMTAP
jgi:hypothetical protein